MPLDHTLLLEEFDRDYARLNSDSQWLWLGRLDDAAFDMVARARFGDLRPDKVAEFRQFARLRWLQYEAQGDSLRFAADTMIDSLPAREPRIQSREVFLVHGHDEGTWQTVARFLEYAGLTPIVLGEQPDLNQTVFEKFKRYSGQGVAVVVMTADDLGALATDAVSIDAMKPRARQNVIFEYGFFLGKLGWENVIGLISVAKAGPIERPSDLTGVTMIPVSLGPSAVPWRGTLARELEARGFELKRRFG